jgi:ABC-type transport system involved in Fe-S cluster assembly fused permease/ATPase subunit
MLTQLTSYAGSIVVGCCIGYLYGLLFVYQKKGALSRIGHNSIQLLISQIIVTVIRFSIIAAIIWYLLPLPQIHFILVMMNFFIFFWIVVTQYKGDTHE